MLSMRFPAVGLNPHYSWVVHQIPKLTPSSRAEFPLQWLGECLIHQSILYEGNPDRTNIRERFLYKFDDPKPQEQSANEPAAPEPGAPEPAAPEPAAPPAVPALQEVHVEPPSEATMNDATGVAIE